MRKYKADAYLRLSYTADRKEESDSISNQKKLIEDFVAAHPDIEIYRSGWTMVIAAFCLTVRPSRR